MRYLLAKSIQLMLVVMAIGVLVTLSLSNIVEAFKMLGIPANGLTNNYYAFSVGECRDKIIKNNILLVDMLNFLEKQNTAIVLLKETDMKIFGVYAVSRRFEPDIVSGRTFSEDDFENKTTTIVISEDLINSSIEKNGTKFYRHDTIYFEVIGVFRRSANTVNQDALAYFNLATEELKTINIIYDNHIFGNFQIDAGQKTTEIVKKLDDYITVEVTRSAIDNTFTERLQKTLSTQRLSLSPIVLVIALMLLNSIDISSNWIENRKKEIFVRRLVGATNQAISLMLLRDFMVIVTLSYIPALVMAVIVSEIDLQGFHSFRLSIDTVAISYIIVMLTGLISAGLMLVTYYKRSVSQIGG